MNSILKIGDRIILFHMEGDDIMPGEKGVVTSINKVYGVIQYGMKWDNGSTLALLSDTDIWKLDKKQIKEDEEHRFEILSNNIDVFKFFKMKFLYQYLRMVRESSIVNMMEAAPYLWIGRERIEHQFKYKNINNKEAFNDVLNNADKAQSEMINGVINYLESKDIEESLENINKYLKRFAVRVLQNYRYMR